MNLERRIQRLENVLIVLAKDYDQPKYYKTPIYKMLQEMGDDLADSEDKTSKTEYQKTQEYLNKLKRSSK